MKIFEVEFLLTSFGVQRLPLNCQPGFLNIKLLIFFQIKNCFKQNYIVYTAQRMPDYRFSLTFVLPYKDRIEEFRWILFSFSFHCNGHTTFNPLSANPTKWSNTQHSFFYVLFIVQECNLDKLQITFIA